MSTIVYQKLQPCYDSNNFIESRRLSLKLNAPKDNFSQSSTNSLEDVSSKPDTEAYNKYSYSNMFGWSGIEAPSNTQPEYIHPLVKRSSSKLSQKSLEMCTESLGCETGTCIMESSIYFQSTMASEVRKSRPKMEVKKEITQVKLPPPLTTLSGPNSIQVKPVRKDGRLVITAVSAPAKQSYLQAERSNGRLRLSLIRDNSPDYEDNYSFECETLDNNENEGCITNDSNDNNDNDDNNNNEGRSTEAVSNGIEDDVNLGENMNDVKIIQGVKVGLVKIQMPSRCKERGQGNKRLVNWEPFWVAT